MLRKILSFFTILLLIIPFQVITYAQVDEQYEWVIDQYKKNNEKLIWEKVWFLIEGIDSNWRIKRNEYWYPIEKFLNNDSVKNINSWFNWDFWNVRLETSSKENIASYFPTVFNWNIPHKLYELKDWEAIEWSWEKIYLELEKDKLCTYWFTRSINSENDITTKIDVYWVSQDGNRLIWKDTYNSTILKQVEKLAKWDNEKLSKFVNSVKKNSILIEHNWKHEIYNYSNYAWNIKQSIIWPDMSKYSVKSYLEKVENNISNFDSEIRFSDIITNQTSELENGKHWNYISYGKDNNQEKHKYFIINKNNLVWESWIINLDINKLFIQYKDLINGLSEVDSEIVKNIKSNYWKNIFLSINEMLNTDINNLYEKGRIKNSLILIDTYLSKNWVPLNSKLSSKLYNNTQYNELKSNELVQLASFYYTKFLETLELKFTTLHINENWETNIVSQKWNFRQDWTIWTLDEINTNIGFHLYNTNWKGSEFSFDKTINYWDIWSSFWVFPKIKLESWDKVSFLMWFALPWNPSEEIKKLYNSIIWGSELSSEYIKNKEFKYIYWLKKLIKDSSNKSWKLSLKFWLFLILHRHNI